MYYLKLKFEGARLFRNTKDSLNKHIQLYENERGTIGMYKVNRSKLGNFVEPIALNHISNVIHCLFGKRPVPSNRMVGYSKDEYLYNKAKDSYLYIRPHYMDKNNEETFAEETVTVTKSDFDAWNKIITVGWFDLRYYLSYNEARMDEIKEYFKSILSEKIVESKPLYTYIEKLREVKDKVDINFFKTRGITPLFRYIGADKFATGLTMTAFKGQQGKTVGSSIHKCNVLDGEILVPIDDTDIERLKNYSTGTCKILDGGYVTIEHIVKQDKIRKRELETKFKKVSDLSQELIFIER